MPHDKFNVKIQCRHCKSRGFQSNHHPNDCKTCYACGIHGHKARDCQNPKPMTTPPTRQTLIDNRHLLIENEPLGVDVEKVQHCGKPLAAWVVITQHPSKGKVRRQQNESIIYSAKIRRLRHEITSFQTPWSGLAAIDLSERSIPIEKVQRDLRAILNGRMLVGIGLRNDLESLGIDESISERNRFDFLDRFKDERNQPISLKYLAFGILGKKIQEFAEDFDPLRCHNPIINSRTTIKIFKQMEHVNNQPINGCYQWIRNLVDYAIECGQIMR